MTHPVVSVRQSAPFKEIARTLADHEVSAVPVVDAEGRVMGIVSEADLLRRAAARAEAENRALIRPAPGPALARESEGRTAEELMTAPAVCAGPEWSVAAAARLMTNQQVKRLPVVDEADHLVGIVSRSDLLRVFLRTDQAIAEEIHRDILRRTLHLAPSDITVSVRQGRVSLTGSLPDAIIPVLERLCASVDGVVSFTHRLTEPQPPDQATTGTGK